MRLFLLGAFCRFICIIKGKRFTKIYECGYKQRYWSGGRVYTGEVTWCEVNWRDLCEVILLWSEVKWSELRWSSWGQKYPVHQCDLILRVLDCIVTVWFGVCLVLWLFGLVCVLCCGCLVWCVYCVVVVWTSFVMCVCGCVCLWVF